MSAETNKKENVSYEVMYERFLNYQREMHEKNQKKIKVGLKINIILPLFFLVLSFITKSSKLVFLMLWIISLFGIAFYLLYVEYSDHMMIKRIQEFSGREDDTVSDALIGEFSLAAANAVSEKIDEADAFIGEKKQALATRINDLKNSKDK